MEGFEGFQEFRRVEQIRMGKGDMALKLALSPTCNSTWPSIQSIFRASIVTLSWYVAK